MRIEEAVSVWAIVCSALFVAMSIVVAKQNAELALFFAGGAMVCLKIGLAEGQRARRR